MNKEYFDTDSTGYKKYSSQEDAEKRKQVGKVRIKTFSISTDKYKKTQDKVETVRYEIKD